VATDNNLKPKANEIGSKTPKENLKPTIIYVSNAVSGFYKTSKYNK
jgi:hypothetical protein